ncbi:mating-type switching protein swi10 [Tuber indicum]|nr:mating-type switching protein swi10 [Tuber indicum]
MDDDLLDDETMVAALDAAEKALNNSTATSSVALSLPPPSAVVAGAGAGAASSTPIQQPIPQKLPKGSSSILVSTRQKGNPLLTHIKNVPWEYASIPSDYLLGATPALFLSLKYHRLHPEYIYTRVPKLPQTPLRILLVLVDIDTVSTTDPLKELTKTSLINNLTVVLCWSAQEAGRYLEAYKSLEKAAPTTIMGRKEEEFSARMVECVTKVRSVNRVDAVSLVANFGSLRGAINAKGEEMGLIAGWGERKVARWERAVGESFRVGKKSKISTTTTTAIGAKGNTARNSVAAKLGIVGSSSSSRKKPAPAQYGIGEEDEEAFIAAAVAQFAAMEEEEHRLASSSSKGKEAAKAQEDAPITSRVMDAVTRFREQG